MRTSAAGGPCTRSFLRGRRDDPPRLRPARTSRLDLARVARRGSHSVGRARRGSLKRAAHPPRAKAGRKVNCGLSSRYLPRISAPVPCISQTPRLARHQPPPRMHCCASLTIRLVVAGAGIVEAHPARSHTVTAIPIASRITSSPPVRLKPTELHLRAHPRVAQSVRRGAGQLHSGPREHHAAGG